MMNLLVRIEPKKNMDRWYSVAVQPTLLDPWAVICSWGSRRTRYRRIKVLPVKTFEAGEELATNIIAKKVRRGYTVKTPVVMEVPSVFKARSHGKSQSETNGIILRNDNGIARFLAEQ